MASHLAWTSGNWKCQRCSASIDNFFFQSIDKIMFQYKNLEQNILINDLTPDKKSGNTIH